MLDSCLSLSKFKLENTDGGKLTLPTPFSGTVIRVNQLAKTSQLIDKKKKERVQGRHDKL